MASEFKAPGPNIVMLELESKELSDLQSGDLTSDHYTDGILVRNARSSDLHITLCNRYTKPKLDRADLRFITARLSGLEFSCPEGKFVVFNQSFRKEKGAPIDADYDVVVHKPFGDKPPGVYQEIRDHLHKQCKTQPDFPTMQVHTASEYFVGGKGQAVAEARNAAIGPNIRYRIKSVFVKVHRGEELYRFHFPAYDLIKNGGV